MKQRVIALVIGMVLAVFAACAEETSPVVNDVGLDLLGSSGELYHHFLPV